MIDIRTLLKLADIYIKETGLKDQTLSYRMFGDSKKLTALRGDADITTGRFNSALVWFSKEWPSKARWPREIERPAPQTKAQ